MLCIVSGRHPGVRGAGLVSALVRTTRSQISQTSGLEVYRKPPWAMCLLSRAIKFASHLLRNYRHSLTGLFR